MSKILFWIGIVFLVLFGLRLYNAAQLAARRRAAGGRREAAAQPMVRCERCRTYIPRTEALPAGDGFRCASGPCAHER
ncbi:MAG: hypothetical protein JSR18_01905 [Proteobacteria bacterium]|nr:hypothetical protein [Pseudomonadota bacterium]